MAEFGNALFNKCFFNDDAISSSSTNPNSLRARNTFERLHFLQIDWMHLFQQTYTLYQQQKRESQNQTQNYKQKEKEEAAEEDKEEEESFYTEIFRKYNG